MGQACPIGLGGFALLYAHAQSLLPPTRRLSVQLQKLNCYIQALQRHAQHANLAEEHAEDTSGGFRFSISRQTK